MEVFHCYGNVVPSNLSLWNGFTHFITVTKIPATSNGMKNNLTEISVGWISECIWLSLMWVKEKHVLNASALSAVYCMPEMLKMMTSGIAEQFGCERASNIWEVFWVSLVNLRADIFCILKFSLYSIVILAGSRQLASKTENLLFWLNFSGPSDFQLWLKIYWDRWLGVLGVDMGLLIKWSLALMSSSTF